MNRQKIGQALILLGLISIIVWQALTWFQSPMQRIHTAEELSGTVYSVSGAPLWIRIMGGSGLAYILAGVLLSTGKKGSYFWLLGFLPSFAVFGIYWNPSQYVPELFGIGGTVILLSYLGILWLWARTHAAYESVNMAGSQIQLLGYSFLVETGLMLCMYFGNPNLLALADLPIPSGQVINLTMSLGMLLLFVGHYVTARHSNESMVSP